MAGSIRTLVGFLLCFGAVGGLDNNSPILACMAIALVGLCIMYSGVAAIRSN